MAETYEITGQHYTRETQANGISVPVVEISFKTKTVPPVEGKVSVPQALTSDSVAYVEAVKSAVEMAVAGHVQAASL